MLAFEAHPVELSVHIKPWPQAGAFCAHSLAWSGGGRPISPGMLKVALPGTGAPKSASP